MAFATRRYEERYESYAEYERGYLCCAFMGLRRSC